ncbi:MAG: hypothetical protein C0592_13965 [Marinilabiliales bacterium]|nr:MAG: hypothetical protein C0592_13965 [Marinilabiliales bacterium]
MMKKTVLLILNKLAAFFGWKWLYLIAGIGLLGGVESCTTTTMCYDPVEPVDSTSTNDRPQKENAEIILNDTARTQQ